MATYNINKGIGRPAEFKGLTNQYLFLFAGGLLGTFFLFVIFYLAGISTLFCLSFALVTGSILVYAVFYLNKKYGPNGLMKKIANRKHPRFIISRKMPTHSTLRRGVCNASIINSL